MPSTSLPPSTSSPPSSSPSFPETPEKKGHSSATLVREPWVALAFMATSAVLFSLMNVFARLATQSASWATVAAVRACTGAMVAWAVARARGSSLSIHSYGAVLGRSVFGTLSMLLTFYALSSRTLALGDTVTLLNLTPVYLAVLAPIVLRERTTLGVVLAIGLSLAGVIFVLRPAAIFGAAVGASAHASTAGPGPALSAASAVTASFFASIAMMMLRRAGRTESTESIAFYFSLFAAVVLGIIAAFDVRIPMLRDVFFMIGAGVCAGFAQLAMTRAYTLESAARVSGIGYLAVVTSALLGAVIFHETPPWLAFFGMALVIAGGLVIVFFRSPAPAQPSR